jgi:hypothetical protein
MVPGLVPSGSESDDGPAEPDDELDGQPLSLMGRHCPSADKEPEEEPSADEPDSKRCRRQESSPHDAVETPNDDAVDPSQPMPNDDDAVDLPPKKWIWINGKLCKVEGLSADDHMADAQPRDDFCCSDVDGDSPKMISVTVVASIDANDGADNGTSAASSGRSTPSTSAASSAVGAPQRLEDMEWCAPHPFPLVDWTDLPAGAAVGPTGSRAFTRLMCMRVIDVLGDGFRKQLIQNVCSGMVRREASIFAGCDMYLDLQNQLIEVVSETYSCPMRIPPMRVHHTVACEKVQYKRNLIAQREPRPDMIVEDVVVLLICSLSLLFLSECFVCMCVSIRQCLTLIIDY